MDKQFRDLRSVRAAHRWLALCGLIGWTLAVGSCGKDPVKPTPTCAFQLQINQASLSAGGGGGTATVTVSQPSDGCSWTGSTEGSWLSVSGATTGTAQGTFDYTAQPNTSQTSRPGSIVLTWTNNGSQKQQVTQAGVTCDASLGTTTQSFSGTGGTGKTTLTTNCDWSAASDMSWLHITSSTSGSSGIQDISYSVDSSTVQRTGTIKVTVAGSVAATLTVTQSPAACVFNISQGSQSVNAAGGQFNLGISASATCASWRATSDKSFVTFVGKDNGTGDATISYKVDPNTTGQRTANINVVAGSDTRQLPITQETGVLAASFKIISNTGLANNNCRVDKTTDTNNPAQIRCTFDASASTPASIIATYDFVLKETNKSLVKGSGSKPSDPTTSCGFPYGTEVNIVLTITATDGRTATTTIKATFIKATNGPC